MKLWASSTCVELAKVYIKTNCIDEIGKLGMILLEVGVKFVAIAIP